MATTREQIQVWIKEGQKQRAIYMIVATDTFDWEDYPIFCQSLEEAKKMIDNKDSMTKIMEVYNLSMDIKSQLNERRAWHLE